MKALIRCAGGEDLASLEEFLGKANLNTDGIGEMLDYFIILENGNGKIIATLGIEPLGKIGLLRSLAMDPQANASEQDLFILFEQAFLLAKDKGIKTLYLASNKKNSMQFFRLLGFREEEKGNLPEELHKSDHVTHILTVDNSFFLKLSM